jgi:chemotaxis protein CheZ
MQGLEEKLSDKIKEIISNNDQSIKNIDIQLLLDGVMAIIKDCISSSNEQAIYNEIEKISNKIRNVKQEVYDLDPTTISQTIIPGATSELSAVTEATEKSTNIILDSAEYIQSQISNIQDKELSKNIGNKVIEIFEACNFQDITGQRINKVIKILEEIDSTLNTIITDFSFKSNESNAKFKAFDEKKFLNGPQISAPSQNQIDDLFNK